jgi:hypothetical protein
VAPGLIPALPASPALSPFQPQLLLWCMTMNSAIQIQVAHHIQFLILLHNQENK